MSRNQFDCLTNALLCAGAHWQVPATYEVAEAVRQLVESSDVRDVRAVTIHQCPKTRDVLDYHVEVVMRDGETRTEEFEARGVTGEHNTYVLYDSMRDGAMKHLHLLH